MWHDRISPYMGPSPFHIFFIYMSLFFKPITGSYLHETTVSSYADDEEEAMLVFNIGWKSFYLNFLQLSLSTHIVMNKPFELRKTFKNSQNFHLFPTFPTGIDKTQNF